MALNVGEKKFHNQWDKEQERIRLENLHDQCTIYLKIVHYNMIKKLFEILAGTCGVVGFVFTKDKLLMNTYNESQKMVIHLELNCEEKMTYHFQEQTIMYVNARKFYNDVFKIKDKKAILYLYRMQEEFYLSYLTEDGGVCTTFKIITERENCEKYTFPTFQFTMSIPIKSQLFHRLLSERKKTDTFELFVRHRCLILSSDRTISSVRGDCIYEPQITFPTTDKLSASLQERLKEPISIGEFSVRKCNLFYKLPAISEHVVLHMNTDDPGEPLACEYKLAGELGTLFAFYEKNV